MKTSARRRRRRWLVIVGLVVLVLSAAFGVLRIAFEGPSLADNIASLLNKHMRGRIEAGSIEWDVSSLQKVVTGGWIPLTLRDVRVWDDCALSAATRTEDPSLRVGDPNEDCTPDDRPDPDPASKRKPRKLLVRTDLVTVELDAHSLMFGNHDLVFRHLWLHGGEALLEQSRELDPLTGGDRTVISLISAFFPRQIPSFRAGIQAGTPPPLFDLRDIHITGLNLTLHMAPSLGATPEEVGYGFTARIEGVDVDAASAPVAANRSYLYVDSRDPVVGKFYVRLTVAAQRATMRIADRGPRSAFRLPHVVAAGAAPEPYPLPGRAAVTQIGLTDVHLDRLAQLPSDWARNDFVANTLEVDLRARAQPCPRTAATATTAATAAPPGGGEQAALRLSGELFSYFDRPYDGAWNLKLDATNLGPTLRSCLTPVLGGSALDATVSLTGPFIAPPAIGLDLSGVDVSLPLGQGPKTKPLDITIAEAHGKIDLVNEDGYIEKTKAVVHGTKDPGELALSATFGLNPSRGDAQIEITKPINIGPFLPPSLAGPLGTYLQGKLRASAGQPPCRHDGERPDTQPTGQRTCVDIGDIDLALGPAPYSRQVQLHGGISSRDQFKSIDLDHLRVDDADKNHADIEGYVDIANNDQRVEIGGEFPALDVWLRRFGLPALFRSAGNANGGGITLTGPLNNPTVTVHDYVLAGVPCVDKLSLSRVVRADNTLTISGVTTPGLGGELSANGTVQLGAVPVIERLDLSGSKLDASRLCGLKGAVRGTIDEVDAHLHGEVNLKRNPLDWLGLGQVYARAEHLTIFDDAYTGVAACLNRKDDKACRRPATQISQDDLQECEAGKRASTNGASGFCLVASASRNSGGALDATIAQLPSIRTGLRAVLPVRLGGAVSLSNLPLALIDQLRGAPWAHSVGGLASLTLQLQGAPSAPQATGAIDILRSWLASGFIGDAVLRIDPATVAGVPGIVVHGSALAGRLTITASLGTEAPYPVELVITGRRVEVDPFIDLDALLGIDDPVQLWASGKITIKTELAPQRPIQPDAWIELSELVGQLDHRASDGRITPLAIQVKDQEPGKRPAMSLHVTSMDPKHLSFELACRDAKAPGGRVDCPTVLTTPAGDLVLAGRASQGQAQLTAHGDLDLATLRPLLDQQLDEISGRVRLDAQVSGELTKPLIDAALDLDPSGSWQRNQAERDARRDAAVKREKRTAQPLAEEHPVTLRPVGSDAVLMAPHGKITLSKNVLKLDGLTVQMRDERRETGELVLGGTIDLNGTPRWDVQLTGVLPAKLLQVAAPKAVAQADGRLRIDGGLRLSGEGRTPFVGGTLVFERFSVTPRGGRRELTFNEGTIHIATDERDSHRIYALAIDNVNGKLDDGQLSDIGGDITLRDGELSSAHLRLNASGIPYRIPQTIDLVISASDINIQYDGPGSNWKINGGPGGRGSISVIDGAYVRDIAITDQIQTIGVNSAPSVPLWDTYPVLGSVAIDLDLHVQQFAVRDNVATVEFRSDGMRITGTPRDPHLSGQIRVTHGEFRIPGTRADFVRTAGTVDFSENRAASNPDLNITSDADYRDLSGQDHVITATIGGSLSQPTWDLKTSTGYNKSQTITLLFLGRNSEQLRRSLGDANVGSDPTRVDPTTNPSQGFGDQIVKDLAGDWVSGLLGSSLTKLTGLDVLRIEIGFGSIGFHVEKKVVENLKLSGDFEQTIRGTTIKGVLEQKTPFSVSLQLGYLSQNYYDPAEQDIRDINGKLVYRVFIP